MSLQHHNGSGFTLIDVIVTVAIIAVIAGIGMPLLTNVGSNMKLGDSTRQVERELQTARTTAVSANQAMRVRFDCPAVGNYRMVELVGTPSLPAGADSAADRCSATIYPFPAGDKNPLTRPNNDGPMRSVDPSVTFSTSTTIEFWPDGTAHTNTGGTNPWPPIAGTGYSVTLTRKGITKSILVNGSGKIQLQ
jgi:Tfp pilus assembly protein FimT